MTPRRWSNAAPHRRGARLQQAAGLHYQHRGLEPICHCVTKRLGAVAKDIATELQLRHGHGSNPMSNDFYKEISFLSIKASSSFEREPEGNGVVERFIHPLKENQLWVLDFETIERLCLAQFGFAHWY